ncbi:MAG TPA: threonine--tRNA ligase [Methylomusa anaerophila]|uniref:Threonine--tRNA ligase n=1 Tax=Methylomusa anaerophila TaxID=1930071 RepID=A0A348AP33_9FIRM|nr:threonine--tRNA ligase [Methylomusa anaerophila]BBB92831.1 threonine--tRNA ligase 2 [Methylomusa anaerophila]HML87329.1 threonine--tRNA ligase [Methylomusa anaerophila]
MSKVKIVLKDGAVREYEQGTTLGQLAESISRGLAKAALVAKVDGHVVDLNSKLGTDANVEFVTFETQEGKDAFRHTASHILAQAVKRLYGDVKLGIGPSIANGFYYDFDTSHTFTPEDLVKIQAEMEKIVKEDLPLQRMTAGREEAIRMFGERGENYKQELIQDLPADVEISLYKQGEFIDLCAGPHVPSTGKIKSIKLQSIAGAYWRGDEKRKMLQRIYGTAFEKKADLDAYITMLEEAVKRDHRKLGKELGLFSIEEEGPGFPFFHPKGMVIRNELETFWRKLHNQYRYQEIKTPIILNQKLWQQSGHWDHYKQNMYFTKIDEEGYAVKPMNCPGGILVYRSQHHSYRDLPLRMCELGLVHRHEISGALHGLMRVRSFTQDDAHIFMLPSQIKSEIKGVIELFNRVYGVFGLSYHCELSTKPEKAMGSDEIWELATSALQEALEELNMPYKINPGDGAFYGPKIDFHLRDSIGRTWQCGTIQLDMLMPEKFDLTYIGEDGQKHRPVMIHRVAFGSMERFIGILIEHYAGAFPVWLAPVQVKILPITERHAVYARDLEEWMRGQDIRVEIDDRNEKIGYKIREGQLEKVPYMLVVGDKEVETRSVAVRKRGEGDIGTMPVDKFINQVSGEIKEKI